MNSLIPLQSTEGTDTGAILKSTSVSMLVLSEGVEQTLTTPMGTHIVSFATNGSFFLGEGNTPITVPLVTQSPSLLEWNPSVRRIPEATVLRFISSVDCIVQVSMYQ